METNARQMRVFQIPSSNVQYRKLIPSHEFAFHTAISSGVRKRGRVEEKEH